MATSSSSNDDEIVGINVTPLVDVMLVLLVIFMVTATYITNQSIELQLPKASSGKSAEVQNIAIAIDKDSQIYVDGKPVSIEALGVVINQQMMGGANLSKALIAADQATPHGSVIKVIDLLRNNGIKDFAMQIESGK